MADFRSLSYSRLNFSKNFKGSSELFTDLVSTLCLLSNAKIKSVLSSETIPPGGDKHEQSRDFAIFEFRAILSSVEGKFHKCGSL